MRQITGGPLTFARTVLARSRADFGRERRFLSIALLAIMVPGILIDSLTDGSGAQFLTSVLGLATLYVQLLITFRILDLNGAAPPGYEQREMTRGRFGSVFVAGLFGSIGIMLGLLLLIVPGIILMLLWSLSTVTIAAEGLHATDGLRRSWSLVRPAMGQVAPILSIFLLALAMILLATGAGLHWLPGQLWLPIFLNDVAAPLVMLGSAILWVHVYLALRDRADATT